MSILQGLPIKVDIAHSFFLASCPFTRQFCERKFSEKGSEFLFAYDLRKPERQRKTRQITIVFEGLGF